MSNPDVLVPNFETQRKEIDNVRYSTTVFPAGVGFQLLYELKAALGDTIGNLVSGDLEKVVSSVGGRLSKGEMLDFIQRLLGMTFADDMTLPVGKKEVFDVHFAKRYGHLLKVLSFVVEANFADFFEEVRRALSTSISKFNALVKMMGASGS